MANIRGGAPDKKRLLSAARFLGGGDLIPVEIPEITDEDGNASIVLLKQPSAARILGWQAKVKESPEEGNAMMCQLIGECVVSEDGSRLFNAEQAAGLGESMGIATFTRIANALMDLANAVSFGAGTATAAVATRGNASTGAAETAEKAPELTDGSALPSSSASASESGT